MRMLSKCLIAAAAGAALIVPANAAPIAAPSALQHAVAATVGAQVQSVQWRRGWGSRGWIGPAVGAAIISGAIAASRPWPGYYYGSPSYYYYDDYAYAPGYAVAPGYAYVPAPRYRYRGNDDRDVAYCERRFRSYDRDSGTYTGYDGEQHPCP